MHMMWNMHFRNDVIKHILSATCKPDAIGMAETGTTWNKCLQCVNIKEKTDTDDDQLSFLQSQSWFNLLLDGGPDIHKG